MPRILLHVCCGPCSLMPVVHLREEGLEPAAFFFNPNIHPADEWRRRRDAMRRVAEKLAVPLIEEGPEPDPAAWIRMLDGVLREGERCPACYWQRLERTAWLSLELGFDAFTTSLLYSKYQHHNAIRAQAGRAAARTGAAFLYRDFRPYWQDGVDMAASLGIYRQKWCGCLPSMKEARDMQRKNEERRAAEKAEAAARLAREAEDRRLRRADFTRKQARKEERRMMRLALSFLRGKDQHRCDDERAPEPSGR